MSSEMDSKKRAAATMENGLQRREITGRDLYEIIEYIDEYPYEPQFEKIEKDVCLDPHDERNNSLYSNFRSKNGSRLTKEIVDSECILIGFDKAGLSAALNVAIPPGASMMAQLSTWVNPCHGDFDVCATHCFGIGMVPVGSAKEQTWSRGNLETCIEDGVQYYSFLDFTRGFRGGMDMYESSFSVMEDGSPTVHHKNSREHLPSLNVVDIKITRDIAGNTEFSFVHGSTAYKVNRPARKEKEDMQLYFNCMGWADNNTYVQIHKVVFEPLSVDDEDTSAAQKKLQSTSPSDSATDDVPDYAKILSADPVLRQQVDALIEVKKQQDSQAGKRDE